jgi:hypothetical protein
MAATTLSHHYVAVNGVKLHYVRQGAGEPLLLIHGWPGFWYEWGKNIPALAEHFDVIAPDMRGYAYSDKPEQPPEVGIIVDKEDRSSAHGWQVQGKAGRLPLGPVDRESDPLHLGQPRCHHQARPPCLRRPERTVCLVPSMSMPPRPYVGLCEHEAQRDFAIAGTRLNGDRIGRPQLGQIAEEAQDDVA